MPSGKHIPLRVFRSWWCARWAAQDEGAPSREAEVEGIDGMSIVARSRSGWRMGLAVV